MEVLADHERLLQALGNLVGNAVKFSPRGGVVTMRAAPEGDRVEVAVIDGGPGIALEDQAKVFDAYWTKPQAGKAGTGLGLSIARGIVEAHGGTLRVESEPGKGATFTVSLPLVKPGAPAT
jgi:signal transduction histidine kinase